MNRNPRIITIIPITINGTAYMLFAYLFISNPVYTAEMPKNSKLIPIIIETSDSENIGKIMKIKPRIMDNSPMPLLLSIGVTSI